MLFPDAVFVGVDFAPSHRAFTYVALDKSLNLVALAEGDLEEVTAFAAAYPFSVVAVNAPSGVSRAPISEKKKEMFKTTRTRGAGYRQAEIELRQQGIPVAGTPATVAACSAWVRTGFTLYKKLEKIGFKKFPVEEAPHQILETNPLATFSALSGSTPQLKNTLEGRMQRQLILYELGVRIKDPMDFFEEITRHKMLNGIWPIDLLYQTNQLDAMSAAFIAWHTLNKPEALTILGDAKEGHIILPSTKINR